MLETHGSTTNRGAGKPGAGCANEHCHEDSSCEKIRRYLSVHPVFVHLAPVYRRLLCYCATVHCFEGGAIVLVQGLRAKRFYLPMADDLLFECLSQPDARTILTISSDGLVGTSWCFAPYRWRCTLRILQPARMVVLDAELVNTLFQDEPDRLLVLRMVLLNRFLKQLHHAPSPCLECC